MIHKENYLVNLLQKGKNSVFLLFVFGTFVFWFLNKLSKESNQIVTQTINYVDLPTEFIFQEEPPQELSMRLQGSGFYFLSNVFKKRELEISLKNIKILKGYTYFLESSEVKEQVRSQFKNHQVLEVLQNRITVKLGKKSFKKVPVVGKTSINYQLGYNSFTGVQFQPDSIEISGPDLQVNKIKEIHLTPYIEENVRESLQLDLAIIKPQVPKISYSADKIKMSVVVEKITEKTLLVPVVIKNAPIDNIVIYPKKVKITCQVLLSQFNDIKKEDFILVCDYKNRGDKHMNLQLITKPKIISGVKLQADKVEYLILK